MPKAMVLLLAKLPFWRWTTEEEERERRLKEDEAMLGRTTEAAADAMGGRSVPVFDDAT